LSESSGNDAVDGEAKVFEAINGAINCAGIVSGAKVLPKKGLFQEITV